MAEHWLVETPAELARLSERLQGLSWVALDTEFLRERSYYPKLCLLQLAGTDWIACVDPLALPDMEPLLDALYRRDLLKVMHACTQDLEILFHLRGELPSPVFDTQLAAPLLGHAEQLGYANLVRERLGVNLAKAQTRTDWSRRPLRAEQLEYAADDVRYLARLFPALREELQARGRLDWLREDFDELLDPARYARPAADAWQRIRGTDRLPGAVLARVQALAEWRERTARESDRARNLLLRDEQLVDIARQNPRGITGLGEVRGISEALLRRHGEALLALLAGAEGVAPRPHPSPRPPPPGVEQEALADALMAVIRLTGMESQLNPASLASRKDVLRLIAGEDSALLHGWRKRLVGTDLRDLLQGRAALRVEGGRLRLVPLGGDP